jgi:UDP-3-O-[3-hydroxymyristoyl] glucosamine N-acyltransferase
MLKKILIKMLAPKTIKITAGELADKIGLKIQGNPDTLITGIAPIADATAGQIAFYSTEKNVETFKILPIEVLKNTKASVILLQPEHIGDAPKGATLLIDESPRAQIIKILNILMAPKQKRGIDKRAIIERGVYFKDKKSVYVGPNAYIESGCTIGANVVIESGAYVGGRSIIGDNSAIRQNAVVECTTTGADCEIQCGASVGKHGFGYSVVDGKNTSIPHLGRVILGERVDIGANSCVDRGVMGDTKIGVGTKIDNLCQIGHNVVIGEECFIAGMGGIAGSAVLGNRVMMAGQAGITNKVHIGDNVEIGTKTGVAKDAPSGVKLLGFPAVEANEFLRMNIWLRKQVRK